MRRFEGEHAVEKIRNAGRTGDGRGRRRMRRGGESGTSGGGLRKRRGRGSGGGRCGDNGRGGLAEFFGEQGREDFGERGGLGDARGFLGHGGGCAMFGDAGVMRRGENAGELVDFEIERFGMTTGGAQEANAPVDPAHIVQELIGRTCGRGQRCAVQGDSARPEREGSVSRNSGEEADRWAMGRGVARSSVAHRF